MKRSIITKLTGGLLAVCALGFFGCKDDESSSNPIKAYVSIYDMPTRESINDMVFSPNGLEPMAAKIEGKYPCRLTREAPSDITLNVGYDKSLIDQYNATNKTDYLPLPESSIKIINGTVHIRKGEMISYDSIKFEFVGADALERDKTYIAPIGMLSASASGIVKSVNSGVFVIINTRYTNCYTKPNAASMAGLNLVTDKTGWTGTITSDPVWRGDTERLFDGNGNSYVVLISDPKYTKFDIDLGKMYQNITGIQLVAYVWSEEFRMLKMDVFTSTDGVNYTKQGLAELAGTTSEQYVKFYAPVNARYIRLDNMISRSTYYAVLSEFWIFQ